MTLRIGAYPVYSDNPWQEILYGELRDRGAEIVTLTDLTQQIDRATIDVLHINWTGQWTQSTPSSIEAGLRARAALSAISDFQAAGGKVVWTVHNVLPHEVHNLGAELLLCRGLARTADAVMIMNPDTPALVRDWYHLPPERVVHIPHPSYVGWFADVVTRDEARERFGFRDDEIVVLFFGLLRRYKGLDELVDAFAQAQILDSRLRLMIVGASGHDFDSRELEARIATISGAELVLDKVADDDVQWFARAADLMVLPYRASLNISVAHVAATFDLPVVMSDSPSTQHFAGEPWVTRTATDRSSLADSMIRFGGQDRPQGSAKAAADAVSPSVISTRFAQLVSALVGAQLAE